LVSAASTPQTVADYNVIDPAGGGPLYVWGGASYTSLASFTAATGQGTHDIAASPDLQGESFQGAFETGAFGFPLGAGSPAIDSADANAPGEQPTDQFGNARADDPAVPNTGTGRGYYDRGAIEEQDPEQDFSRVTVQPDPADGPLALTVSAPITSPWTTNGSIGTYEYLFSDSPFPVVSSAISVSHVFTTAGENQVEVVPDEYGFPGSTGFSSTENVVVGADYTPVTPTRILDTRYGIGAEQGAIPAGGDLTLPIPAIGQLSAADLSAVVVNVTVTGPTAAGSLTVFTKSGTGGVTSNINFTAGQTLANLVTIQPASGAITFQNNSSGTVQVIADLDGYYSNAGSGYQWVQPERVLDTRNKIGTAASGPVPAHGTVRLNLSGQVPAGATAAVLNLTATGPSAPGFITADPNGEGVPGTSNLNFAAGQTVPNQVIVPLNNDVADFYNGSSGTVQLVADLDGYYASGVPNTFVPYGPTRIVDTRSGLGVAAGAIPAHGNLRMGPFSMPFINSCTPDQCTPVDQAEVVNVTVTQPKAAGFLTVYAYGQDQPATSNVNFSAGQTVANQVTVQNYDLNSLAIYNGSNGSVQIVVDEEGYFIDQP
jgi:hypothetical protein